MIYKNVIVGCGVKALRKGRDWSKAMDISMAAIKPILTVQEAPLW